MYIGNLGNSKELRVADAVEDVEGQRPETWKDEEIPAPSAAGLGFSILQRRDLIDLIDS